MASNLEIESLHRFDRLVESGDIIFQGTSPILVSLKPFNLQFRIADSLTKKPQIDIDVARKLQKQQGSRETSPVPVPVSAESAESAESAAPPAPPAAAITQKTLVNTSNAPRPAPSEKTTSDKPTSPFDRDPPPFILSHPTTTHTLRFNKFCVVRPQFVLHTNEWQSQIDPLQPIDFEAGWTTLRELGDGYMLIFNGGTQGGWSLPHRHMQLLPLATGEKFGYELWPDMYASSASSE
ncbi:hypothetical protein KEM54_005515, partial [Ascosphaera aggregata]